MCNMNKTFLIVISHTQVGLSDVTDHVKTRRHVYRDSIIIYLKGL